VPRRCRCLSDGPRRGRRLGGGGAGCRLRSPRGGRWSGWRVPVSDAFRGASAVWVAPEGVACRAGAVPRRCRCLSDGPRRGRRLGGGGAGCRLRSPRGGRWSGWRVPVSDAFRGASAVWVAPEGVACRAGAVPRRCRCLSDGPRRGRRLGGGGADCLCCGPRGGRGAGVACLGGAGACLMAPEGVAVWAVACRLPLLWPPRGSWRGRGGVGPVRSVAVGAPRSAVVPRGVPVTAPKSGRWYSGGADASKPRVGPARRPPRRMGLSGPWVRLAALRGGWVCRARGPARRAPEGGWVVGPSGGPSGRSSEEGRVAGPGVRGWRVLPLRRGAAVPATSVGPSPRGGLGSRRPPVALRAVWGKPRLVRFAAGLRPSEEGRARASRG
jgi:hypothetical protein